MWGQSGYWQVLEGRCDKRSWSHSARTGYEYIQVLSEIPGCVSLHCVCCVCVGHAVALLPRSSSHTNPFMVLREVALPYRRPCPCHHHGSPGPSERTGRATNNVVRLAAAWGAGCGPLYLCVELVIGAVSGTE